MMPSVSYMKYRCLSHPKGGIADSIRHDWETRAAGPIVNGLRVSESPDAGERCGADERSSQARTFVRIVSRGFSNCSVYRGTGGAETPEAMFHSIRTGPLAVHGISSAFGTRVSISQWLMTRSKVSSASASIRIMRP
jgi:hypothetical protein